MKTQRYTAATLLVLLGLVATGALLRAQEGRTPAKEEQKHIAVLQSKAPLFDKARACQQLAVVGTPKAIGILAALLDDERLSGYARFAMEPMDDPSVDKALREAMGRLKGRLLAGVVNSIGVRRDAKAVPGLKKLAGEASSGVAPQALAALGRIATAEAVETIRKALTTGPAELRAAAADACLAAAERLSAQNKPSEAGALYDAIRKADVPEHLRAAATYHAIVVRGADGAGMLIELLRTDNAALRAVALRAARAMPAGEVTVALAAELSTSRPDVQVLLIEVLVERRDPRVLKAVAGMAASGTPEVRAPALKALGRIGDASAAGVLLKAAAGGGKEAAIALASLRTLENDGVDPAILTGMKAAKGDLRVALIGVLADRRYGAAAPALLAEAASADESVAKAAFKALGVLAGAKDLPALVQLLLAAKSDSAGRQAETAIVLVAARMTDPSRRADAVLAALAAARKPVARASLLRVLGRIGGRKAYRAVAGAIDDADADVKDAAIRALASWPDTQAEAALLDLAKNAANQTHRILALWGYVRLLGLAEASPTRQTVRKYAEAMATARGGSSKKRVLGGLAGVGHRDALALAMEHLGDPAVRSEAALAATKIARAIMGSDRKVARAAMEKLLAVAKDQGVASEARRIIRQIDRFADSITAWRIAGPYSQKGMRYNQLFDIAFEPEKPNPKGVRWRPLPAGTDPKRPWLLDLLKAIGGEQRVAYALTWIHSERAQPARLELGSDDGVKAWLNGQLVHANNTARAAKAYTDKANVTLKAGWNPLLLKITQNNSPWEFCARLCRRDGRKLGNLRIDAAHNGDWALPASASAR